MVKDSLEARLLDIEAYAGCVIDSQPPTHDDLAWLVALVRRYRAAPEVAK